MAHLKRHTRVKGGIKDIRHFCKVHGKAGRNVVRFAFRNWQRIAPVSTKYKWRVRRLKAHLIFKRLYREDTKGDEDWSAVAQKVPVARTVPPEEASTRERLEREYLAATFQPLQYYSVEREEERQNEDGAVVREKVPHYFQLLAAQTSQTREKTMHTVETADDITRKTGLLLHVLNFSRWHPPDADDTGVIRVFSEDDDAEWVRPCEVADFDALMNHLTHYRHSTADPEFNACIVLSNPQVGKPRFPLTDMRTPTLQLAWHLKNIGWVPTAAHCKHEEVPVLSDGPLSDSREAPTMKCYYMVLAELARCLPLSMGGIPSQEPVAYYRCLLANLSVASGLANKEYVLTYNRALKGEIKDDRLLPHEEPKPLEDADGGFFVPPIGAPMPKPRAGGHGRGGGGRGRARGRGAEVLPLPPAGPPPPIVEPPVVVEEEFFADPADVVAPPRQAARAREDRNWIDALDGCRICFQPYTTPGGKVMDNYLLQCPRHDDCMKSRGLSARYQKQFGEVEIIAALHAWSHIPWPTATGKKTHRLEDPTDRATRAYALEHLEALQDLLRQLGRG